MTVLEVSDGGATLALSLQELAAIANALNAVCHDVHVRPSEITTLIGAHPEELKLLLREVGRQHAFDRAEGDEGLRMRKRVGQRIVVRAKEADDVVATKAEVPPFRPVMRDLPALGPVMNRLQVHLAEPCDVLRRVETRGYSGSHRSPRST